MIEADGVYLDLIIAHREIAELKAERDALAAENARLRDFMLEYCVVECDDGYGVIELPAEGFFPKTINTDAYLNSVRAEGLKMAIDHMNNQTSDDCADVTVLPVIEMYNQLRAGEPS